MRSVSHFYINPNRGTKRDKITNRYNWCFTNLKWIWIILPGLFFYWLFKRRPSPICRQDDKVHFQQSLVYDFVNCSSAIVHLSQHILFYPVATVAPSSCPAGSKLSCLVCDELGNTADTACDTNGVLTPCDGADVCTVYMFSCSYVCMYVCMYVRMYALVVYVLYGLFYDAMYMYYIVCVHTHRWLAWTPLIVTREVLWPGFLGSVAPQISAQRRPLTSIQPVNVLLTQIKVLNANHAVPQLNVKVSHIAVKSLVII